MEGPAHLSLRRLVMVKYHWSLVMGSCASKYKIVSPLGEQVNPHFPDKAEVAAPVSGKSRRNPVANTEESTSEKKSGVASNETPARVVAARSQSCGKAPAGPQEDIIVASQSNVAPERNAQHPSINVITQSDCQQAAAATNKRGATRSSSPNRRITRAISLSAHIFRNQQGKFPRNFKDNERLTREPDDREVRNHLLTVLTDFARDTAEEALDRNPDASSDEMIDALRAQYEDQYSTQHRLDAIKACFQYAQEPVQDYYQRTAPQPSKIFSGLRISRALATPWPYGRVLHVDNVICAI
uniref:Uncharacterized protein n=1 Tax=Caenorhabditis japonica TaxID=281687 RepID=A0A8R1EA55_CAEJA